MLKLPKDLVADPRHEAVASLLQGQAALLWDGGKHEVARVPMSSGLASSLREGINAGLACQGLEAIGDRLAGEQKGLDAIKDKQDIQQNPRVSRVVFITDDGSTRFYRDVEVLLNRYAQRLMAVRVTIDGEAFGEQLFGKQKLVRSVLVFDKKLVARSLLALVPR